MTKISLFHAGSGDWEGLYVDGVLKMENHSLDATELLVRLCEQLDFEFTNLYSDDEYLERYGNRCPDTWEEIKEKEDL